MSRCRMAVDLLSEPRYGGLRCPSEHLSLKWTDVDFDAGRIRVPSPKTEHIEGLGIADHPDVPRIAQALLEAFEQAPDGAVYVIHHYRDTTMNLRTQFQRIIRRAGLTPWPKLFHNLRSTRQTELAKLFPIHVVCELGSATPKRLPRIIISRPPTPTSPRPLQSRKPPPPARG